MELTKDNIIPVGKRLLVEAYKQADETSAGLAVASGEGYAISVCGTVIRAGEGCKYQKGDVLIWRRYSLDSMKVYTEEGEQEIFMLDESEVLGYVQDGGDSPPPQKRGDYPQINEKKHAQQEDAKVEEASSVSTSEEVPEEGVLKS